MYNFENSKKSNLGIRIRIRLCLFSKSQYIILQIYLQIYITYDNEKEIVIFRWYISIKMISLEILNAYEITIPGCIS